MFDPCRKPRHVRYADCVENWEADIDSVVIEACKEQEDTRGYRVVYCRRGEIALRAAREKYVVGASFLKDRLDHLKKAGFDAPMTLKAIRTIEIKLCCCLF